MKREDSWGVFRDGSAIKYVDKSCFESSETGIPRAVFPVFGIAQPGDHKNVILRLADKDYSVEIKPKEQQAEPRMVLRWPKLVDRLREDFKDKIPASRERQSENGILFIPAGNAVFDIQFFLNNELPEPYSFERKESEYSRSKPPVDDKAIGNLKPKRIKLDGYRYERCEKVVNMVKELAAGRCEHCNQVAPFCSCDCPFLEVHHVKMLSQGGPDTIDNAVALCPNCHRELHYGEKKEEMVERLYANTPRLEPCE